MGTDWPLGVVELKVLDLEREVAFYAPDVRGIQSFEVRRIVEARTDPNGILIRPD